VDAGLPAVRTLVGASSREGAPSATERRRVRHTYGTVRNQQTVIIYDERWTNRTEAGEGLRSLYDLAGYAHPSSEAFASGKSLAPNPWVNRP